MDLSNLQAELVKYGTLLVQKYKAQLKIDGTQATGDTEKSLNYVVGTAELQILADKSLEYIDEGRKPGEAPPLSAIAQWARAKGIKPRGGDGSFIKSTSMTEVWMIKNIAKSIAENGTIKRFGYKGSGIIDFVYLNQKDEMLNNIFAAYGRDVQEELNRIVKTQ
jgi:hypothetical protein